MICHAIVSCWVIRYGNGYLHIHVKRSRQGLAFEHRRNYHLFRGGRSAVVKEAASTSRSWRTDCGRAAEVKDALPRNEHVFVFRVSEFAHAYVVLSSVLGGGRDMRDTGWTWDLAAVGHASKPNNPNLPDEEA